MTKLLKKATILALVSTTALTACGDSPSQAPARSKFDSDTARVNASFSRFGERQSVLPGSVQVSDEIYVGATRVRGGNASALPARMQSPSAVSLKSSRAMNLVTIASRLSEITGIQHIVSLGPTGTVVTAPAATGAPAIAAPGETAPAAPANNIVAMPAVAGSDVGNRTMIPNFSGPLPRVLDEVAGVFGVDWEYKDGRVIMRDYVTRQYHVSALPTTNKGSTEIGGSGSSDNASSSLSASSETALDVWNDIRSALTGLAGPGANISMSPTTGMITVTARSADQDRIASYIRDVNSVSNQQLSFDVNVLTVTLNDSDSHGIDLDAVFNPTGYNSSGTAATGSGAVNIGVATGNFSLTAVVNALSRQGKVSVSQRAGTTTSNNRLTPINVVDSTSYVRGTTYNRDSNGNVISSDPDIETVDTGFQMQLLPRVVNNRDIMLQYVIRLSELTGMTTVEGTDGSYQLPQISETAMEQQAVLGNGQTLILSGFERNRVEIKDSGLSRKTLGFGGTKEASRSRVATVILIRPSLVKR